MSRGAAWMATGCSIHPETVHGQAARLLQQNTASIDTLSVAVGYSTPYSFCRAFFLIMVVLPKSFLTELEAVKKHE